MGWLAGQKLVDSQYRLVFFRQEDVMIGRIELNNAGRRRRPNLYSAGWHRRNRKTSPLA